MKRTTTRGRVSTSSGWTEIYPIEKTDYSSLGEPGKKAISAIIEYYDRELRRILVNLECGRLRIQSVLRKGKLLGMYGEEHDMWEKLDLDFIKLDFVSPGFDEIEVEFTKTARQSTTDVR